MAAWDPEAFENAVIADMRAHGGQVTSGPMAGRPMIALTTTGAVTGQPRRALLSFSRDRGDYIVAGTAGGSPTDPKWIANIRAHSDVDIEADGQQLRAHATIEPAGPERQRLWDQHVVAMPWFGDYPKQIKRPIPMVRLTPR